MLYSSLVRILYHMWLSPACRKVRLVLAEKKLDHNLKVELDWEKRPDFLKMNPAGTVPVLIELDGTILADAVAITEYLEDSYSDNPLLPAPAKEKAEVRRIVAWFDQKFKTEVSDILIREKIMKRYLKMGAPNSNAIRCASQNIKIHLDYISYLIERRNYLASDRFSLADISAAAHISVLDYLGDVNWEDNPLVKEWYMKVKSRRSFQSLLKDRISGLSPAPHYGKLDF